MPNHEQFDQAGRPLCVKIGPHIFDIRWVDTAGEEHGNSFGKFLGNEQVIYCCANRKREKIAQTFIHEVCHAIHWNADIYLGEDRSKFDDEERITGAEGTGANHALAGQPENDGMVEGDAESHSA